MPDYDIAAVALAVPAQSAPVTTYRPAVRVRNNGIHPANVTGYLRMYRREPPGDLLASWPILLQALAPGNEGNALAEGYWIPLAEDIGREFLFTARVDTDNDQNPGNNDLSPVTVLVTSGTPPPEPIVTNHATQHEDGGTDELHVDGLAGELADAQPPKDHAARHQQGGTDEVDITNLPGLLADPQTPAEHGNESHDPAFTTPTEIANAVSTHNDQASNAHTQSQNLEHTVRRGANNGYAGLSADATVEPDQVPSPTFHLAGAHSAYQTVAAGNTDTILDKVIPSDYLAIDSVIRIAGKFFFDAPAPAFPVIHFDTKEEGGAWSLDRAVLEVQAPNALHPAMTLTSFEALLVIWSDGGITKSQPWLEASTSEEHGPKWGDWVQPYQLSGDTTLDIEVRIRLEVPNIPGTQAFVGPVELNLLGKPQL